MRTFSVDTETTGLDDNRGCAPFAVGICDEHGDTRRWVFPVDPMTRVVEYQSNWKELEDLLLFLDQHSNDRWFWWNMPFDMGMLAKLPGIGADRTSISKPETLFQTAHPRRNPLTSPVLRAMLENSHDGLILCHQNNAGESHALKDFGVKYLGISDADESRLDALTLQCHNLGKRAKYLVSTKKLFPSQKKNRWKGDMHLTMPRIAAQLGVATEDYTDEENGLPLLESYLDGDTMRTFLATDMLLTKIESDEQDKRAYYDIHRPVGHTVIRIASVGLAMRPSAVNQVVETYDKESAKRVNRLSKILGEEYKPNNREMKSRLIYDKLAVKPTRFTAKDKKPSCDKYVLKDLKKDKGRVGKVVCDILATNKFTIHKSYAVSYDRDAVVLPNCSILYPQLNQTGTRSGRFSSSNPNGQNIGAGKEGIEKNDPSYFDEFLEQYGHLFRLRNLFGPRPNHVWLASDYVQLQMFIFAYACGDRNIIAELEAGADYHTAVARIVFGVETPDDGQRRVAKIINFGFIFGAQERRLTRESGIAGLYDILKRRIPRAVSFLVETERKAKRYGYVETLGGYKIWTKPGKEYAAVCDIVQGTEAEVVKLAMVKCDQAIGVKHEAYKDVRIVFQVHDELLFEMPPSKVETYHPRLEAAMISAGAEFEMKLRVDTKLIRSEWSNGEKIVVV